MDVDLDRVRFDTFVPAIQRGFQLAARYDTPGIAHQHFKHRQFLGRQFKRRAVQPDLASGRIELHRPDLEDGYALSAGATDQRPQPGAEFVQIDRLDQVVVGTAIQSLHLVQRTVTRGQHQHRRVIPQGAQFTQQSDAVQARQA